MTSQVPWNVQVARKYIKLGIARDLSNRKVATLLDPPESGLYLIRRWYSLQYFEYRCKQTGVTINAIAKRVEDGAYIGAVDERVIWGNPAYEQPPVWSR